MLALQELAKIADAVCEQNRGVFFKGQQQVGGIGGSFFGGGSPLCSTMKQIKKNAQSELDKGPSLPWTDTSFIEAYIATFCEKE